MVLDPQSKYDCALYNGHDCTSPRKLNRENFEDWPSAKIEPHENFPLYGIELVKIVICYCTNERSYYTCSRQ